MTEFNKQSYLSSHCTFLSKNSFIFQLLKKFPIFLESGGDIQGKLPCSKPSATDLPPEID